MFGYVRPSDGHLTAEDKQRFQAAYCGLCRSLGRRYGLAARMILNYDLAFLAMLLSREPECPTAHCRCPAHPIRGCDALERQPAFDTAADLSVILTWWQLTDGVADHGFFRGLPYRMALTILGRAYRKARARRPGFDQRTRTHLEELARLEGERCPSMDRRRTPLRRCWPVRRRRSRTRCAAGCWSSCCTTWAAGSIWWMRRTT